VLAARGRAVALDMDNPIGRSLSDETGPAIAPG
jgi:hypothetical protein